MLGFYLDSVRVLGGFRALGLAPSTGPSTSSFPGEHPAQHPGQEGGGRSSETLQHQIPKDRMHKPEQLSSSFPYTLRRPSYYLLP